MKKRVRKLLNFPTQGVNRPFGSRLSLTGIPDFAKKSGLSEGWLDCEPLAQVVEHQTFNLRAMGSNPMRLIERRRVPIV